MVAAAAGCFASIAVIAYLALQWHLFLLVPSLGASAVLLFAAGHVPMARPRRIVGGHLISALIGVLAYKFSGLAWWTLALSVTAAMVAMMVTDTLHPPGGATAFAAVCGCQEFSFVIQVLIGALILVFVALAFRQMRNFLSTQKQKNV